MNMNDHSWRRRPRLGRSRSGNSSGGSGEQLRSSPPTAPPAVYDPSLPYATATTGTAGPPASPSNPRITIPQQQQGDTTTNTPPKKTWERQYKSFLTRRLLGGGGGGGHHSPRNTSGGGGDASGGDNDSSSGRGGGSSSGSGTPGKSRSHHRLFRSRSKGNDVLKMPEIPNIMPSKSSNSEADVAVRGGNFFQSVFSSSSRKLGDTTTSTSKDSIATTPTTTPSSGTTPPSPPPSAIVSDGGPLTPSQRQRAKSWDARKKSTDSLDSTLRGGYDKNLSPLLLSGSSGSGSGFVGQHQEHHHPQQQQHRPLYRESSVHGGKVVSHLQQQPHQQPHHLRHGSSSPSSPSSSHLLFSSVRKSREMKRAFTEFHNSSQFSLDASSAYLGDEPSVRPPTTIGSTYLAAASHAMPPRTSTGAKSEVNLAKLLSGQKESKGSSLPTVTEDVVVTKSTRILKPVQGPETWETGRRYLIAPAALSTCPLQVLRSVSGGMTLQDYTTSPFGTVELGTATVKYVGARRGHYNAGNSSWSTCKFLLKQNYLLEYDVDGSLTAAPRGFAHLQYATCSPHPNFADSVELEFYASPCAKSDKRVLFIRLANRADRDRWVKCLNEAARLTIKDLYDYDEEHPFGRGRYAVVYPARRRCKRRILEQEEEVVEETLTADSSKDYTCALKIIDKNEFWRRVVKGMERADTIVRETSVQATVAAKCAQLSTVLQIRGAFETSDNYVIELELLEGTDLFQYISSKKEIDENESALIMFDILTSLDAMARIGIAHRDIKPANILMCNKEESGIAVKVADFGMAGFAGVDGNLRGRCGTPGYVAPEIFTTAVHGGYGNKVDVFSAGVTLYVLLCGYEPFYGESDAELIAANKAAIVEYPESDWSKISLEARELVEQMLQRDPRKRISANDALQHPWIKNRRVVHNNNTDATTRYAAAKCSSSLFSSSAEEEGNACAIS